MSTPRHGPRSPEQQRPPDARPRPVQRDPQERNRPADAPRPPAPAPAAARDPKPVTVLRLIAYVLTSVASLLFIVIVVYAYIKIGQLQQALSSNPLFGGNSSYSAPAVPSIPSQGELCQTNPDAPECAAGLN